MATTVRRNRVSNGQSEDGAPRPADQKKRLKRAAQSIKLLADPTRLAVVMMLAEGERNVSEICAALGQTAAAASHHLALLRFGGVIEARRVGKTNVHSLTEAGQVLAEVVRGLI